MKTFSHVEKMDIGVKLSTLWIVVMLNMICADILSFLTPGALQSIMTGYADKMKISQGIILIFALIIEIPIAMVFLARTLKPRANRIANIAAGAITILFVVGGGSAYYHYVFFAAVQTICILVIMWSAIKWPEEKGAQ